MCKTKKCKHVGDTNMEDAVIVGGCFLGGNVYFCPAYTQEIGSVPRSMWNEYPAPVNKTVRDR